MRAAADLGRDGPRGLRDHRTEVTIPRSRRRTARPLSMIQVPRSAGRVTEHTGLTTGLGAIGEAFGPAANMIFGQSQNRPHGIKAILLASLGR